MLVANLSRALLLDPVELQVLCSIPPALRNDGLFRQENEEATMNTIFSRDVYIRLAEDDSAFACTIKYARFFSKTTEFLLNCELMPEPVDEPPVPLKRRFSPWASGEQ
jgi:hypothetical protein